MILSGPTAVGKTRLSIELAKEFNGEIISADSMQVYRGMDIGSAKIRKEEMEGIPHHLIDVLDPSEEFHVARFQQMAKNAMEEIYKKGKLPIVVGGTGFYIQALLYDVDFSKGEGDASIRSHLLGLEKEKGEGYLYQKLREIDFLSAEEIHPHNKKRILRALEFFYQTGEKISEHNAHEKQKISPYEFSYFVLHMEREILYQRIEKRVDKMIEDGLIEEVKRLYQKGYKRDLPSMQGLGYKEILGYLDGEYDLSEGVYRIKRDTRHFAKRQLTWFRREKDVIWLDKTLYTEEEILSQIKEEFLSKGENHGKY